MKLSWSFNMQKGGISNLKEPWPQMNKVDPCSTINHSHKNTRWIYVSTKFHMKCDKILRKLGNRKNGNATVSPRSSIQVSQKGTNPNHVNKGVEVEHGGNRLITG